MEKQRLLGVMVDCSRNAVMRVERVKEFVLLLAKMGYNALMLYTEDTFEVEGEPYFGYMRGRYTKAELKELDTYCREQGVELIPCIQTLAHLNCMFKWGQVYGDIRDCDDVLLIDEEKTYRLIENMFATVADCFTTRRIHIGMDEAYRVGLGRYLDKYGYQDRFEVINRHLHRVCDIAAEYGFSPMIWSDMFCKLALSVDDYYRATDREVIRQKAALPENVSLVYWDYYSTDYQHYADRIRANGAFGNPVVFAGGVWTWKGFAPDNAFAMKITEPAVRACQDGGVGDVFFTMWGDDGAECSKFAVLPALMYAAETVGGNGDMADIKAKFQAVTGLDFDSLLLLDGLDTPGGQHGYNPSKYLLYNDPFTGLHDYRCTAADGAYYAALGERIRQTPVSAEYAYVFETAAALCDVLAVKSDLGVRTRTAYQAGDKAALHALAETDYPLTIERVRGFHGAFQRQWLRENKPNGFDVQDIRLGGLMQRLSSCRDRLLQYVSGETDSLPELEETLLAGDCGVLWGRTATPNVVAHEL